MKLLSRYTIGIKYFSFFAGIALFVSCNKELPEAKPIETPEISGETIMEKLNAPEYSILKAAIEKAGTFTSTTGKLSDILANREGIFTFFAPDNAAILRSFWLLGLPEDASSLNYFRAGQLDSMLKYHLIGGLKLTSGSIAPVAPALNMYLQSSLMLAPPSADVPPGYRMPIFLAMQDRMAWVNNVPILQADIEAANGVMHKLFAALLPPDKVLWQTIAANAGGDYDYFKAAVIKADGGDKPDGQFQKALSTANANFTVLVPTNAAFQQLITGQITLALVAKGMDLSTASASASALVAAYGTTIISNPASIPIYGADLAAAFTPELIQGILAYHFLIQPHAAPVAPVGFRNFTAHLPATTAVSFPTLVNGSVAAHPGVTLKANYVEGALTKVSVQGLGNATPANMVMTTGNFDLNHINGIIDRIDQVLLPQ